MKQSLPEGVNEHIEDLDQGRMVDFVARARKNEYLVFHFPFSSFINTLRTMYDLSMGEEVFPLF